MTEFSLNEVEALALKVGRSACFSWGLAEDIARGGRALAQRGLPWAEALVGLARDAGGWGSPPLWREARPSEEFEGHAGLCPVRVAAKLMDDPSILARGPVWIPNVGCPIWIFALFAASGIGENFDTEWSDGPSVRTADVVISPRAERVAPIQRWRRAQADPAVLAELASFAARVYVPASAESRARGAGGGRVDDE